MCHPCMAYTNRSPVWTDDLIYVNLCSLWKYGILHEITTQAKTILHHEKMKLNWK